MLIFAGMSVPTLGFLFSITCLCDLKLTTQTVIRSHSGKRIHILHDCHVERSATKCVGAVGRLRCDIFASIK